MDWLEEEMDALDDQLERGEISRAKHQAEVRALCRDAQEQQDRDDIRAAGRGHLLREW